MMNRPLHLMMIVALIALIALPACTSTNEVSQATLDSISTPDEVRTSIGTLRFLDGAPYPETAQDVYDYVDTMRGVEAFLRGIPGASVHMLIHGPRNDLGAEEAHQVMIFDELMDSTPLFLTGNTSTMYVIPTLDLKRDGPTVLEVPAGGPLGAFNDAWFRYLADIGPAGADKGQGGKYLVLPPDYDGKVPEGYFVVPSTSYDVWVFMRFGIENGLENAVRTATEGLRIYPLSKKDNPPAMEFIRGSGKAFNTVHANNFKFYEEVNRVIQKEPLELLDPETRGLFASIGIEKGKPFAPDARMKRILEDAVKIGNAAARSIVWYPRTEGTLNGVEVYPGRDSAWNLAFLGKNVFFNGEDGQTMNTDARVTFHYPYTAVTPAMALSRPGKGSDYAIAFVDSKKQPFDGSKTYRLRVPADPPAEQFWAVTVYDPQTRSQLQTSQPFPTVGSQTQGIELSADGSCDLYFSPKPPRGYENNWIQTTPGKGWFPIFRMYGPMQAWIDKTWRPSEIEMVDVELVDGPVPTRDVPQVPADVLASISTPDVVQTSIGTLRFLDGAPYPETAEKVYDFLDTMRGVNTFLKGVPAASIHCIMRGVSDDLGADEAHEVVIFDELAGPRQLGLTYNSTTMYIFPTVDLERDGPTVVEVPAGALGALNDAYFRYVADVGPAGQDRGEGGKYLILPPGYEGEVPEGYFVMRPRTYENWLLIRYSIADGLAEAAAFIKGNLRIYPLAQEDDPPAMEFISGSDRAWNTVHANNFVFYEELNAVIQKEPMEFLNPELRGLFASVGIVKGEPFEPDARMKRILVDAVAIGNAAARAICWYPREDMTMSGIRVFEDRNWFTGYSQKNVFFNGPDGMTMNTDARVAFHYPYTVVTPAMANPRPGSGSDYGVAYLDADNRPFDGSKTYKVTLPKDVPVNNFWAFTVYDSQTRSMLQTDQPVPSIDSINSDPVANADGSIDVYFAPEAPAGKERNWIQTVPGKSWFVALRMYGPLEPWFEQTWVPSDIERVD